MHNHKLSDGTKTVTCNVSAMLYDSDRLLAEAVAETYMLRHECLQQSLLFTFTCDRLGDLWPYIRNNHQDDALRINTLIEAVVLCQRRIRTIWSLFQPLHPTDAPWDLCCKIRRNHPEVRRLRLTLLDQKQLMTTLVEMELAMKNHYRLHSLGNIISSLREQQQ